MTAKKGISLAKVEELASASFALHEVLQTFLEIFF